MGKIFSSIKAKASKRSPEICIGVGLAGMFCAVIFTGKATVKAKAVVEDVKEELKVEELPKKEVFKLTWKYYIPTAVLFATSTALIILADHKHNKRNAALSMTCAGLETTLNTYKDKLVESVGKKKSQQITDQVNQETLNKNPVLETDILPTGKGDTLIYDVPSGRYFRSNLNEVDKVINNINKKLLCYDFIPLNDLYEALGLPGIGLGKELGWNMSDGFIERYTGDDSSYGTATNGEPCKVLSYLVGPRYEYH